ncbi:PAS domain S-box protein (plasmid) [Sphingomonas changnyeongensis]|uniref:histidine kinase n=1 Tax=Sphingomonas changnyeongensis TaxID=2698679 RepID=A0A7Z2NZ26_9SPHN|nr:PAS domain-containing protein [Sphingomonas changnyeongensis]QHL92051.1 PAS domain S-box protein [Sphingomonas changnyeongensis]
MHDVDHLRHVTRFSPAMLWKCDSQGDCVYVNDRWSSYTGQDATDAMGKGWIEMVHTGDRPGVHEYFFSSAKKREAVLLFFRVRRSDGQFREVIDIGTPIEESGGNFHGYAGFIVEVESLFSTRSLISSGGDIIGDALREMCQPLTAITNFSSSLMYGLQKGELDLEKARQIAQQIHSASVRANIFAKHIRT